MPSNVKEFQFVDEKYNRVYVYWEWIEKRKHWEWTVYMKLPLHLYDFVWYQRSGKHTTYYHDGTSAEGYHEESQGTIPYASPKNFRLDIQSKKEPTPKAVIRAIDEEFRWAIEENDGVLGFDRIIGIK